MRIRRVVCCLFVKIDNTRKNEDFALAYQPHTTKILDCYIDDTLHQDQRPTWGVVTGGTTQLPVNYRRDFSTGNTIAEYTYNADDITSQTIIECKCECLQCPVPCHYPVTVTLEGTYY